mmetsp:Transcript_111441/g.322179  ORF Transcript_111441/g.322179 Transcript_111441/m.322179 type:complete len:216 (-) Transcript_111441:121-768(-)
MPRLIKLRPAGSAHHLHHVHGGQLVPRTLLRIVDLCALDDHGVGRQVHPPCKCRCGHQDLDMPVGEQVFDQLPVCAGKAGMMNGKPVRKQVLQLLRLDTVDLRLQNLARGRVRMQKLGKSVVLHRQVPQRRCGFDCFLAGVYEDQNLILAGVFHELFVADLIHSAEALDRLLVCDADVRLLKRARAVLVAKVEEPLLGVDPQEDSHILVVRQCGR